MDQISATGCAIDDSSSLDQQNDATLVFEGDDPGAVRFGNFINYYSFHPAKNRIENFPDHIWTVPINYPATLACLDIGCNTGELTVEMHNLVSQLLLRDEGSSSPKLRTLGIDVDPVLIKRAQESNSKSESIEFVTADVTSEAAESILQDFLLRSSTPSFGIVFLMSVTMWIHLVHGDEALRLLLIRCAQLSNRWLVLEPQPWSCYRSAQRRLVRSGASGFPLYSSLAIKGPELLTFMHKVLTEECGFTRIHQTQPSSWSRTVSFYERNDSK
ncbi:hypothetical protein B566_EDAN005207 [Ephemera danica]|nr:hypothetical protein B566_EDAN005207 [Ephemera danica]